MRIPIRLARFGLALMALGLAASPAAAQAPSAGATIGNQAIATYQNAVGETVEVTSNLVETTVNQVAGVTVAPDGSKSGAPGGKVFFPHTITNDGNGSDIFDLAAADDNPGAGDFDPTSIRIYPDADKDGVPDSLTEISVTPSLNAGEVYGVVIEVTIPTTASASESETLTLTATSQTDGTVSDSATDTVTVTGEPVIDLTKSMTPATVSPGDTVTVTLSYQNNGLADATNVSITDDLPTGMTYDAGSAVWSDDGGAPLSDDSDGNEATNGVGDNIDYDFGNTTPDTVTAVIDNVPAGRSATITFTATVDAGVSGTLANTASFTVDNGPDGDSNESVIDVNDSFGVTIADSSASQEGADDRPDSDLDGSTVSGTDTDSTNNDVVQEDGTNGTFDSDGDTTNDSFPQGGIVPFEFVITNHSNVSEVFNLTVANDGGDSGTGFPAGTQFSFTDGSGVPITDSDGDGNPDISLGVDGIGTVTLRADLPDSSSATRADTDPAWEATVTATSSSDSGVSNQSVASLTAPVIGAGVDIENAGSLADGSDVTDTGGAPWTTDSVDPGQTAQFTIVVENTGPAASSYDLEWSTSAPPGFAASSSLPSGWQVRFLDSGSSVVSNTGLIASGATASFTAEVIVPASAPAGDTDVYFRATSPTNGSSDTKLDRVTVNEVIDVTITPDRSAQASEGGVAVMSHTLTNNSNITITEGSISLAGYSAFSGTLFLDVNADGVLDAGDTVIDNIDDIATAGLSFGQGDSVTIFNRVQVPANATAGQQETGTITVGTSLNSGGVTDGDTADNAVDDTVTVVSGDLTVEKYQVVDAGCDHNSGSGFVPGDFSQAAATADPGQCIRYRVVAENTGTANADSVTISDQTPNFTSIEECAGSACAAEATGNGTPSVDTNPGDEGAGTVIATFGTLAPGEQAVLEFTVEIDS